LTGPELKLTDDGSHTLYVPSLNEHYHSHFGAITESKHVFINAGLGGLEKYEAGILEVGFGTGLNALLTALYAEEKKLRLKYVTLENNPVDTSLLSSLNYGSLTGERGDELFTAIHASLWDTPVQLTKWFIIEKRLCDLTVVQIDGLYDVIFFDAFGPEKQPEMWSSQVLEKIAAISHPGTIFVTYSARGELKRTLRSLGFEVTLLPGPPGKRVMTRAVKI
jgi:tRNA U34 5-methylaminomethyl-2-thiouridine-forming methyltransferase MnmC